MCIRDRSLEMQSESVSICVDAVDRTAANKPDIARAPTKGDTTFIAAHDVYKRQNTYLLHIYA